MSTENIETKGSKGTKSPNGTIVRGSPKSSAALAVAELIPVSKIDNSAELNVSRFEVKTDTEDFKDMVEDIALRGLDHPLEARKRKDGSFALIKGFRRLTAVKILGWEHVPARVTTYETDFDAACANLVDNMGRENPSPAEQVTAAVRLRDLAKKEGLKVTADEIGKKIGKSGKHVSNVLRVADKLEDSLKRAFMAGEITLLRAIALAGMDEKERAETPEGKKGGLSATATTGDGTTTGTEGEGAAKPSFVKRAQVEEIVSKMDSALGMLRKSRKGMAKLSEHDKELLLDFAWLLLNPKDKRVKKGAFEYPKTEEKQVEEESDDWND